MMVQLKPIFVFQLCLQEENHVSCYHVCVCACMCVCDCATVCVCVCDCAMVCVCDVLIALIILPCDKQKQVCDHKFITVWWWCHSLFCIYNYG